MGIYLSTPKTEKVSDNGENEKLRYGLSSMQGWRSTMEDAHSAYLDLDSSTSFFGVYDGHGGKAVSKFCAKYLHQQMLKNEAYAAGDIGTAAQKAFLRMDEMMCGQKGRKELQMLAGDKMEKITGMVEGLIRSPKSDEANGQVDDWPIDDAPQSDYRGPNAGSTACVVVVRNTQVVVANAGDSRCVISRNGQAHDLSEDHKPDLEVEKERILSAGGYIQCGRVNGTLNLARAIGDMVLKKDKLLPPEKQILTANPDIKTIDLNDDDDFLVVACDGIWDCMRSQQVVDFVRQQLETESKLSVICERVFDRCIAPTAGGEGCDNMTMILVQFKKPVKQSSSASSSSSSSSSGKQSPPKEDKSPPSDQSPPKEEKSPPSDQSPPKDENSPASDQQPCAPKSH